MSKTKEQNDNSKIPDQNEQKTENSNVNLEFLSLPQILKLLPIKYWVGILSIIFFLISGAFAAGRMLTGEIFMKNDKIQGLNNTINTLEKRNDTLSEEKNGIEKENQQLKFSISTLKQDNSKLEKDFQDVNKELKKEREINNSLKAEIKRLLKNDFKDVNQTRTIDTAKVYFEFIDFDLLARFFMIFLDDSLIATRSEKKFTLFIPQGKHNLKIQYSDEANKIHEYTRPIIVKEKYTLKILRSYFSYK